MQLFFIFSYAILWKIFLIEVFSREEKSFLNPRRPYFFQKNPATNMSSFNQNSRNLASMVPTGIFIEKSGLFSNPKVCPVLFGYVVLYIHYENNVYNFKAQRYNLDGSANGVEINLWNGFFLTGIDKVLQAEFGVQCVQLADGYLAVATMDPTKIFIAIIDPNDIFISNTYVYVQNTITLSDRLYIIQMANLTNDNFVVVYGRSWFINEPGIGFFILDKNLTMIANETIAMNSVTSLMSVAGIESGKFVVAYSFYKSPMTAPIPIYIKIYDSAGLLIDGSQTISYCDSNFCYVGEIKWFKDSASTDFAVFFKNGSNHVWRYRYNSSGVFEEILLPFNINVYKAYIIKEKTNIISYYANLDGIYRSYFKLFRSEEPSLSDSQIIIATRWSETYNYHSFLSANIFFILRKWGLLTGNITIQGFYLNTLSVARHYIVIWQGTSLNLTSNEINLISDDEANTFIEISSLNHCTFEIDNALNVTTFSYQNLLDNRIKFIHDGSEFAPSYTMQAYLGNDITISIPSIAFFLYPSITVNKITIKQNKSVVLNTSMINAVDAQLYLTYAILSVHYGDFEDDCFCFSLTSFDQSQLENGKITFFHDGSTNAPNFSLAVNDGTYYSAVSIAEVDFILLPVITRNDLTIKQGYEVLITTSNINGTVSSGLSGLFILRKFSHIIFKRVSTNSMITNFTLEDINAQDILVQHDGTNNSPSYVIFLNDGSDETLSQATITFLLLPVLIKNEITIKQGHTIILNYNMISGTVAQGLTLTYLISDLLYGKFTLTTNPNVNITNFTQSDLEGEKVQFTHDDSRNIPSYTLKSYDGEDYGNDLSATVSFLFKPAFLNNQITIEQGTTLVLSKNMIDAYIPNIINIIFSIVSTKNCEFKLTNSLKENITQFSTDQLVNNKIILVHDGSSSPPSYNLSITDGEDITYSSPIVIFILQPIFIVNQLSLIQGETVLITNNMIKAQVFNGNTPVFIIGKVEYGHFELKTSPNKSIISFDANQIDSENVVFIHDNSLEPPTIRIGVFDGQVSIPAESTQINFTVSIELKINEIWISAEKSITLSQDNLKAVTIIQSIDPNNLIFIISKLVHGNFLIDFSSEALSFTQKQIINGNVSFRSDESGVPPFYCVSVGFGTTFTSPFPATIYFNSILTPLFIVNQLVITQGASIILTNEYLDINSNRSKSNLFVLSIISQTHGYFQNNATNSTIVNFTYHQLLDNEIIFIHDNSDQAPSYSLILTDTENNISTLPNVAEITFNFLPQIDRNLLRIMRSKKVRISPSILDVIDKDNSHSSLIFYVSNVMYGHFEKLPNLGTICYSFTQQDIFEKNVYFIHEGGHDAPSYQISITDGLTTLPPIQGNIEYFEPKGIGGLKKKTEIFSSMMMGIDYTNDSNYLVASLWLGSVSLIDIFNEDSPIIVKTLDLRVLGVSNIFNLKVANNTAFILSREQTLVIVSLENNNMEALGMLSSSDLASDFLIYNQVVYLAVGEKGVYVVDVSDLKSPKIVQKIDFAGVPIISLVRQNDSLYCVSGDTSGNLYIFNISNRLTPILLQNLTFNQLQLGIYCMITSKDLNYLIIGADTGIIFLNITDPLNVSYVSSLSIVDPVYSLIISSDGVYASAIGDTRNTLINVEKAYMPLIVDFLKYTVRLNTAIFTKNGYYLYICTSQGLEVIEIFKGLKERISPSLATSSSFNLSNLYNQISMSSDQKILILSGNANQITLVSDEQIISTEEFPGQTFMTAFSKNNPFAFVAHENGISILNLSNPNSMTIINTLNIEGGAWGILLSQNEDYVFVSNYQKKSLIVIKIITILDPVVVYNLTGFKGNPQILTLSQDDSTLFVVLENVGIAIVDINDKTKPQIISNILVSTPISLIFLANIEKNYILSTSNYEGTLNVIDVTNLTNPKFVSTTYINRDLGGISLLLNRNYAIIQANHGLFVIEIRNLSSPIIVNQLSNYSITLTYQMALTNEKLYLPSYQSYTLYTPRTVFYTSLSANTNYGQKTFTVNLLGVDPINLDKTVEEYNILSISLLNQDLPYWIEPNFNEKTLHLSPPNIDSLLLLRSLVISFATKISFSEMSTVSPGKTAIEVNDALLLTSAIDNKQIPQGFYSSDLYLDLSFAQDNITEMVNRHYFVQYVNFILDDYLELNNIPIIQNSLQSQIDKIGNLKINTEFSFQIDEYTFVDEDGDYLTYSASNLPAWLEFSSQNQKFSGTPSKTNMGTYIICVTASDGFQNISDYFKITVSKKYPIALILTNQELILGQSWLFTIPYTTFVDIDGDALTYNANIYENGTSFTLPIWMSFDDIGLRLYGTPKSTDVAYDSAKKRFYQVLNIKVTAIDIADQQVSSIFSLTISNTSPKLNTLNTLQSQFSSIINSYLKIGQTLSFEFAANTFLDDDGDELTYTAINFPNWLSLDARKIYGIPTKKDLGDYNLSILCSDGFSSTISWFNFSVLNHQPNSATIPNYTYILGTGIFSFSIPEGTFYDLDNDTLSYNAYLIRHDNTSINNTTNEQNNTLPLPSWLSFDNTRLIFAGNPKASEIKYYSNNSQYFEVFNIEITATDIADSMISSNFSLVIKNIPPEINPNNSLQKQFGHIKPIIDSAVDFKFDSSAFIDGNNGTLTFEARLGNLLDKHNITNIMKTTSPLPDWIRFDATQQKFTISPSEKELNNDYKIIVIASNGLQGNADSFSFNVGYSFQYVFSLFLQIVSTLIALLGLFVYRIKIYNIGFRTFYLYNKEEIVHVHDNYVKKIYLINEDLEKAYELWLPIKTRIKEDNENIDNILMNSPEKLAKFIEQARRSKKIILKNEDIQENGLIYDIIKGYMIHETIKNHPDSLAIFNYIKSKLEKKLLKSWYTELVDVDFQSSLHEKRRFAKLNLDQEKLMKLIAEAKKKLFQPKFYEKILFWREKKYKFDENNNKLKLFLVENFIKVSSLGIPSEPLSIFHFWEAANGQSIYKNSEDIGEIQCLREMQTNNLFNKIFLYYMPRMRNYSNVPNIPDWIDYQIKKGVMIFMGSPSVFDVGVFTIRIFDCFGYLLKQFVIKVVLEKERDFENYKTKEFSLQTEEQRLRKITEPISPLTAVYGSPQSQNLEKNEINLFVRTNEKDKKSKRDSIPEEEIELSKIEANSLEEKSKEEKIKITEQKCSSENIDFDIEAFKKKFDEYIEKLEN